MNKKNKGFTLIELLVVIAIIGILAALVLVALGNARDKAQDARIKSSVGQLRKIAEVVFDNNGSSYGTVATCITAGTGNGCTASIATSTSTLRTDITNAGGTLAASSDATTNAFCIQSSLKTSGGGYFCTDSTGVTKVNTVTKCAAAVFAC